MSLRKTVTWFRRLIWPSQTSRPTEKHFLTIGLVGGLLDYTKIHLNESVANVDADRIAKAYGIDPKGEDKWHNDHDDVFVEPIACPVAPMSRTAWRFFEDVWLAGMAKVCLTDAWSSDDDRQRDLEEVDQRLLMLKPTKSSRESGIGVRFVWDHEYLGKTWTREAAIADAMESLPQEVSELSEEDFQVTVY